jgi:hypothetical protein
VLLLHKLVDLDNHARQTLDGLCVPAAQLYRTLPNNPDEELADLFEETCMLVGEFLAKPDAIH